MPKDKVNPLQNMRFPAQKPDVVGNAIAENIDEDCVGELFQKLPDDQVYRNLCDIKRNLSDQDNDNQDADRPPI